MATKKITRVLFVAAEAAPLAKAGGLADVVGSLPKALAELGVDVRIVLPFYRQIDKQRYRITQRKERFAVHFDGIPHVVRLFETVLPNSTVPIYLIDHPHYEGAGDIYYQDVTNTEEQQELQVERFLFFSRVIPDLIKSLGWMPDVVHCHDWHAAATPFFLHHTLPAQTMPATVYTIHNLPLQGNIMLRRFGELVGVPFASAALPNVATRGDSLNLTALGLATADAITTVSPTYAREILTPAFGGGLNHLLRRRRRDLSGILNGIDLTVFDPSADPAIIPFSRATLTTREQNTDRLRKRLRLDDARPVLGMVTRLTNQKGIELVCGILPRLVQLGCSAVLLGSGEPALEQRLGRIAQRFPKRVSFTRGYDATLAQQIYAGVDGFLMPSIFEPCGLGQMIAMRYGAIPIVRATGGLRDTVQEGKKGTGFVFAQPTAQALLAACRRFTTVFHRPKQWRPLQQRAMAKNFSWHHSANLYLRVYNYAHAHAIHATQ